MQTNKKVVLLGGNPKPLLDFDYSKTPQIDSRLTWARTTTGTVVDFEGLVKTADVNEVRFSVARRVKNLVAKSEDLSTYTLYVTTTRTAGQSDPFGGSKAYTVSAQGNINGGGIYTTFNMVVGNVYTLSYYVKRKTGTGTVTLKRGNNTDVAVTLTTDWRRYSTTSTATGTAGYAGLFFPANSTDEVYLYGILVEDVTGQANQAPSEYVSTSVLSAPWQGGGKDGVQYFTTTNGNTVTNNVVTEAVGTPLTGITLLAEEARTNLLTYSNPTVSGWVVEDTALVTLSLVSPDGTTNATKINELATTAVHDIFQSLTLADATTYTLSIFAKKGERDWLKLQVQLAASTYPNTYFNINTGVVGTVGAGITATITPSNNGYFRCTVKYTNAGAGSRYVFVGPVSADNTSSYLGVVSTGLYVYGAQLEAAPNASSYIPTTTAAVTRTADVPSFTGAGLSWYNASQGTFVVKASGQYSSAPGNIGVWNPLLTGEGSYAITYDKSKDNSAYLYLPNAAAGVNPVEYQNIPTPTTILLGEQGILNMSRFTYYPKSVKANKVMSLVSGTLTTAFDTSYAATTNFTNLFDTSKTAFGTRIKYFPKINMGAATTFKEAWLGCTNMITLANLSTPNVTVFESALYNCSAVTKQPIFDTSKGTSFYGYLFGCSGLTTLTASDTSKGTNFFRAWMGTGIVSFPAYDLTKVANTASGNDSFNSAWNSCAALTTFPANLFDNCKTRNYTNAFLGCALTQTSVDNILVSIAQSVANTPTLTGGTLNMTGGTNSSPSATGLAAKAVLVAAGWTVTHS
jgi:hypothetical protein